MFSICTNLHEKRQHSGHQFHQLAGDWSAKPLQGEAGEDGSGGKSKADVIVTSQRSEENVLIGN